MNQDIPPNFVCNCGQGFQQESAFTRHQKSCTKGKKCLFSALNKAKDLLGSFKRARTCLDDQGSSSHPISADTGPTCLALDLLEITASAPLSASGQDLSLAQRRTRCNDIQLPRHYRQFEDILPQPLPSVPTNHINQSSDSPPPHHTQSLEPLPPFHTPRNFFGLLRQFSSPNPPSHDPEEVTLEDISAISGSGRERPLFSKVIPEDGIVDAASPYYPYPNRSSLELDNWYWNRGVQKSQQSFNDLISIVTDSNFDPEGVSATPWGKINSTLGQNDYEDRTEEWEDEDTSWQKTQVSIKVPKSRTNEQAGVQTYSGVDLYHRSLTGELYQSPAFMDTHQKLQESPRELDCDLPRAIVSLMFWSDTMHLTSFGNAKLWPLYLYFGNESKYRRCKPSCHLGNHVAYFQKLPDSFKDFACEHTGGKGVGQSCTMHCQRELFQAQWGVLLDDEFLEAYAHGIVIMCCDGIKHWFYPRIFTYSADYLEKVLIATIRQLGGCPCPRCLIPQNRLHNLGMPHDGQQRTTLLRSSEDRDRLVTTARKIIYDKNYAIDSTAVENILKSCSWVPTCNVFSNRLSPHHFNVFEALVVDLLHEVELVNKDLVHELDRRYRLVPPFGQSTIRQFTANTSELSNMAAHNFEDLLQCTIPVFDGLLSNKNHNKIIQDLLFTLAHWHGLAKLRMHSDLTLDILDDCVCASYDARELNREVNTRSRCHTRETARRIVSFNLQTYKFHALGDYVSCIRHFGTTDSYSTEPGELEHRTGKGRYLQTDRTSFVRQLTQIEHHQTRIRCIKSHIQQAESSDVVDVTASDPSVHHHIGQSEKNHDDIRSYLRAREGDPAMKHYFIHLQDHLLCRIQLAQSGTEAEGDIGNVLFKRNRIYHHNIARINYTTYDTRRDQDVINPKTWHCNIMVLNDHGEPRTHYHYAKVLGIHHVNVVYIGSPYHTTHRLEFLFVRWYEEVPADSGVIMLDRLCFPPLDNEDSFGFLDPADILRATHLIPCFSKGMRHKDGKGLSGTAGDKGDWREYYVNRFVDRDMLMRFHYGLGVGHIYSHNVMPNLKGPVIHNDASDGLDIDGNDLEHGESDNEDNEDNEDSEGSDYDYTGVEEEDVFDQEKNGSMESVVGELENMFIKHVFDYEP
ncbi:hypothetical protein BDR05DRAFT_978733 [Suillus weaverae]|nr:hypothetical protein BDR05DRAFT_978733 [Suillus weaverae]